MKSKFVPSLASFSLGSLALVVGGRAGLRVEQFAGVGDWAGLICGGG